MACLALWVAETVGKLDDASRLKRVCDLSVDDVLFGPDAAESERRYEAFFETLLGAVSTSEQLRSTEGAALWCFEAQLREVRRSYLLFLFFSFPFGRVVSIAGCFPRFRPAV